MSKGLEIRPPFCSMVRSSGLAEVWTHDQDSKKFSEFGWRCTNKESSYSSPTLMGNWNEQRFDIKEQKKAKPLPSQYSHYYSSTYDGSYNSQTRQVPETLKNFKERHSHPWTSTSQAAYTDPNHYTASSQ